MIALLPGCLLLQGANSKTGTTQHLRILSPLLRRYRLTRKATTVRTLFIGLDLEKSLGPQNLVVPRLMRVLTILRRTTRNLGQDNRTFIRLSRPRRAWNSFYLKQLGLRFQSTYAVRTVDGSILTPAPIVEEIATRLTYSPLAPVGFALVTASANALMFSSSALASNDALPTPA